MPIIDRVVRDFPDFSGNIPFDLGDIPKTKRAVVTFSSNRPDDILIPDEFFVSSGGYHCFKNKYEQGQDWSKRQNEVFWRGSTTGELKPGDSWQALQRARLCMIAEKSGLPMNIGFSHVVQLDEVCANDIESRGLIKGYCAPDVLLQYKYHVDIDGNSNSWPGFFLKLLSGGTTFKVQSEFGFKQWYYDDLIPNEHFIDISSDLKDFEDKVEEAMGNKMKSKKIAENACSFAFSMSYNREIQKAAFAIKEAFLKLE